jgi:hypothetical protein
MARAAEAKGKLRIGDDWNAIRIIALSQSNPLKAIAELVENSILWIHAAIPQWGGDQFSILQSQCSGSIRSRSGRYDPTREDRLGVSSWSKGSAIVPCPAVWLKSIRRRQSRPKPHSISHARKRMTRKSGAPRGTAGRVRHNTNLTWQP